MFEYYSDLKIKYGFTIYTAGRVRERQFFFLLWGVFDNAKSGSVVSITTLSLTPWCL